MLQNSIIRTLAVKVGVDLGAMFVKVSYVDAFGKEGNIAFPNKIRQAGKNAYRTSNGMSVTYQDRTWLIGDEGWCRLGDNLNEFIFAAIYNIGKQLKHYNLKIDLSIGRPTHQGGFPILFQDQLAQLNGKTAIVNNQLIRLNFSSITVCTQSTALVNVINWNQFDKRICNFVILDVGSFQTKIVELNKPGIGSKVSIKQTQIFPSGGHTICKQIADHLKKTSRETFDVDQLETQGIYRNGDEFHGIETFQEVYNSIVLDLLKLINKAIRNVSQHTFILSGGAAFLIVANEVFQTNVGGRFIILESPLLEFGNSLGVLKYIR